MGIGITSIVGGVLLVILSVILGNIYDTWLYLGGCAIGGWLIGTGVADSMWP